MKINVTTAHIRRGTQNDGARCPVALAITEQTARPARVGQRVTVLGEDRRLKWFHTPLLVAAFIRKFDAGANVEPFSFELGKPD